MRRRRVLSWFLAVVLLGVLGFVVLRDVRADEAPPVTSVTGVIGSEKVAFFADERVREVLRGHGMEVRVDPAGSRQIATTVALGGYDFAFPSSSPAADKLLVAHPGVRTYAPFSSPMAVATFAPIVDLLTRAGVVAPDGTTFDVARYLELARSGTRWDQLPGNTSFPARKDVLLSTTAPCQSNSAAMYLGIATYVSNADSVVADAAGVAAAVPAVQPLFRDQGYLPPTSEVLFEDYLSAGMGRVPMALVYEAQYLAEALSADPVLPPDARLLYPSPTIFSRHTLVPLTPAGERVGELLTSDPRLAALAAEHGFRPTDPRPFAAAFSDRGLPEPPALVDVVEPPSFDTLEGMLSSLGCTP
ncbi:hypothetical protein ACU61A_16090 [Pseudonocardia sichuanensis]